MPFEKIWIPLSAQQWVKLHSHRELQTGHYCVNLHRASKITSILSGCLSAKMTLALNNSRRLISHKQETKTNHHLLELSFRSLVSRRGRFSALSTDFSSWQNLGNDSKVWEGRLRGVMANVLDIVVSEFELQSSYYVHFWTNTLSEWTLLFSVPAIG